MSGAGRNITLWLAAFLLLVLVLAFGLFGLITLSVLVEALAK